MRPGNGKKRSRSSWFHSKPPAASTTPWRAVMSYLRPKLLTFDPGDLAVGLHQLLELGVEAHLDAAREDRL